MKGSMCGCAHTHLQGPILDGSQFLEDVCTGPMDIGHVLGAHCLVLGGDLGLLCSLPRVHRPATTKAGQQGEAAAAEGHQRTLSDAERLPNKRTIAAHIDLNPKYFQKKFLSGS